MLGCNSHRIKEYENDDKPIEPLSFDSVSYPKSQSFFGSPEALATSGCLDFGFQETCGMFKQIRMRRRENEEKFNGIFS